MEIKIISDKEAKIKEIEILLKLQSFSEDDEFVKSYRPQLERMSLKELDREICLIKLENHESPVIVKGA